MRRGGLSASAELLIKISLYKVTEH